jgi:hypothetical protein
MILRYALASFLLLICTMGIAQMAPTIHADTDGDTVIDSLDQCPDKVGCVEILGCPCKIVSDTLVQKPPVKIRYTIPAIIKTTHKEFLVEQAITRPGRYKKVEKSFLAGELPRMVEGVSSECNRIPTQNITYCYLIRCDGTKLYKNERYHIPVYPDETLRLQYVPPREFNRIHYIKDRKGEYKERQPAKYVKIEVGEVVQPPEEAFKMSPPFFLIRERVECLNE